MKSLISLPQRKSKTLGFFSGFSTLLLYELFEEVIEEAIAWTITTVITKALSFVLVVLLTQTTKVAIKSITKGIGHLIKPIVREYTYRQGNDKIELIRRIYKKMKDAIKKLLAYLKRNVKTNTATVMNAVTSIGSGVALGGGLAIGGVEIPQWSYYVIGAILTIIVFVFEELGIRGVGSETQAQYDARKAKEQADKEAKAQQEKLIKEIEEQEAKANEIQREIEAQEAEQARIAKEQEEQQRKEIEEQQRKLEIERIRAEYAVAQQDGYTGSIKDFILQQQK